MKYIYTDLAGKIKQNLNPQRQKSFLNFLNSYLEAMIFIKDNDSLTYDIFSDWMKSKGRDYFDYVIDNIQNKKLSEKYDVFIDLYESYLKESIEDNRKQVTLDFLYMIPEKMKTDFMNFGFLNNPESSKRFSERPYYKEKKERNDDESVKRVF